MSGLLEPEGGVDEAPLSWWWLSIVVRFRDRTDAATHVLACGSFPRGEKGRAGRFSIVPAVEKMLGARKARVVWLLLQLAREGRRSVGGVYR